MATILAAQEEPDWKSLMEKRSAVMPRILLRIYAVGGNPSDSNGWVR